MTTEQDLLRYIESNVRRFKNGEGEAFREMALTDLENLKQLLSPPKKFHCKYCSEELTTDTVIDHLGQCSQLQSEQASQHDRDAYPEEYGVKI